MTAQYTEVASYRKRVVIIRSSTAVPGSIFNTVTGQRHWLGVRSDLKKKPRAAAVLLPHTPESSANEHTAVVQGTAGRVKIVQQYDRSINKSYLPVVESCLVVSGSIFNIVTGQRRWLEVRSDIKKITAL